MRKNKKERKRIKRERIENKRLIKKYSFLKPYHVWSGRPLRPYHYEFTWADDMPRGWRKAFGDMMFEEIDKILKKTNSKIYIEQIKEKFGCYDTETQVLTKLGWKYFKDVTQEDKIATLNPETNQLEYYKYLDKIKYHYKGKMYYLENRGVNLCVTPNHNLYVSKGSYFNGKKNNEKRVYEYELTTPDKYFGKDKRFKKGCQWTGRIPEEKFIITGYSHTREYCPRTYTLADLEFNIIDFLKFLGIFIADGYADNKGDIVIAFNPNNFKKDLFYNAINNIGFSATLRKDEHSYRISNKLLASWLINNCGKGALNKHVPSFIKELSPKHIEEFLIALFSGDGCKQETSYIYTTISPQLSSDVQELLIKCGYSFREVVRERMGKHKFKDHFITNNHPTYEINWLKNTEVEIDMSKAKNTPSFIEEWIDYDDDVYCLTVPNHIMYVKRHGKGVWCGNSLRFYCQAPREVQDIINDYSVLSENICIKCGKPDAPMIDTGWICPVCKECFEYNQKTNKWAPKGKYEDYVVSKYEMAPERKWRQFGSNDQDWGDMSKDISDKANKIRAKYRKDHKC